ncbi:hypothetical protein B0J13DRAFT_639308 [Dactylonectria estremocensis]|uniref:Zn(2)-C6 fungal-type domain-containing protein n=1 Tax=Dactylonectria estremocensis TaxID=1079267 RepID=A0A9P9ELU7_9HYPO|nr:hypothetical protein B0J13DRAFT_639308 [Dactylonectria estremocensis]
MSVPSPSPDAESASAHTVNQLSPVQTSTDPKKQADELKFRSSTKRRAAWACVPCRKRKVRCNVMAERPCLNCKHDEFECFLSFCREKNGISEAEVLSDRLTKAASATKRKKREKKSRDFPSQASSTSEQSPLESPTHREASPCPASPQVSLGICPEGPSSPMSTLEGTLMTAKASEASTCDEPLTMLVPTSSRDEPTPSKVTGLDGSTDQPPRFDADQLSEEVGAEEVSGMSRGPDKIDGLVLEPMKYYLPFAEGLLKYMPENAPYLNSIELGILFPVIEV